MKTIVMSQGPLGLLFLGVPPCQGVSLRVLHGILSWDLRSQGALCVGRCAGILDRFPKNSPENVCFAV